MCFELSLVIQNNLHDRLEWEILRDIYIYIYVDHIYFLIGPYYINYGELNIVKNKIDKIISKIKKKMIQLHSRDIIYFLNSKYVS